jgi:hypothetical protein
VAEEDWMMVRSIKHLAAVAALTVIVTATAWAADATGKWTWNQRGQGGNEVMNTLDLKQDGEKLTGTITRMETKTEIMEGKIDKENNLSFVVVREFNGQPFKILYKGKLEGDAIKGNIVLTIQGQERMIEWTANRAKS